MYKQPVIFSSAIVANGYFGETMKINIGLVENKIVGIMPNGAWYRLGLPDAINIDEAKWIFENHPITRKITKSVVQRRGFHFRLVRN